LILIAAVQPYCLRATVVEKMTLKVSTRWSADVDVIRKHVGNIYPVPDVFRRFFAA